MGERNDNQFNIMLREMKKRKWQIPLLICLALLVAAGVAGIFHIPAIAKTYRVTVLTCTAVPPSDEGSADFFIHLHNDDCYDSEGYLVCPLPEIEPHRHTADCNTTARELACMIPESDGHQHTADCYTRVRGDLICEESTGPVLDEEGNVAEEGHVHSDECFEWHDELSCGVEEGEGAHHHDDSCYEIYTIPCDRQEILLHTHTENCYETDSDGNVRLICGQLQVLEHVHGPECFTIYELDDGEPEEPGSEAVSADRAETDGAETGKSSFVFLFPEEDESEETDAETGESGFVFLFPEEDESEETDPAETEATEADAAESNADADHTGETEAAGSDADAADDVPASAEEAAPPAEAPGAEIPEEPLGVRMPAQSFEESTGMVTVRVTAPDGAFPPGTTMQLKQIETESVMGAVEKSIDGEITRVQAVDISFFDTDGNEIEPMVPVHVDMFPRSSAGETEEGGETSAAPDGKVQTILHLDNDGNASVVQQKDSENTESSAVSFGADSFSVYILVYSNTLEKAVLASDGETYRITVSYDASAGIPADAELVAEEILPDTEAYKACLQMAEESVENEMVSFARFFDITILSGGQEVQPAGPVDVKIELADPLDEGARAIHFGEEVEVIDASVTSLPEKTEYAETAENAGSELAFSADGFSIYGVIMTTLEKTITASDGNTYNVSVTYGADAKIPVDAVLSVEEILSESEAYSGYVNETENLLGLEAGVIPYARFFDITILSTEAEKLQPAEGTTVAVRVQLLDRELADAATQVVHFGDEEAEVMTNTVEGDTVAFEASSFSVYAIVDAPMIPDTSGWQTLDTLSAIRTRGVDEEQGLYIGHTSGYYATNQLETNVGGTSSRTGITKTTNAATPFILKGIAKYYFEGAEISADEKTLTTKIFCYSDDGNKQYVKQAGNSLSFVTDVKSATEFKISRMNDTDLKKGFRIEGSNGFCWNMQGGNGGKAFAAYNNTTDVNAQLNFWYGDMPEGDPYGLDGTTCGMIYEDNTVFSKALMAESSEAGLAAKGVPTLDLKDRSKVAYVTKNSDITEWTFHWVSGDQYHITTELEGETQYLTIDANGSITLQSEPVEGSLIEIPYDEKISNGKYRLTVGTREATWNAGPDSEDSGYFSAGSSKGVYFSLAEKTTLTDSDQLIYSASKVSVSDTEKMPDGAKVVIYTRVWNESNKRYEFYVVDFDGKLTRAYDGGDVIQWVGNNLNTAQWDFTEYHEDEAADPPVPNYYYELQNSYAREYLAPRQAEDEVLSDSTVGINLNGRRYGYDYTTIIAWDQKSYAYSGLKVQDGMLVPCALDEADDFYFAIINDQVKTEPTTTVATIDNDDFGITMKMIDYNNRVENNRDSGQTAVLGYDTNGIGLLSTSLQGDYPMTNPEKTGHGAQSLAALYGGATKVNHLLIQSIYHESGYFEYDSTSNFAHLNENGDFKVYDQLGSISDYGGSTGTHGQFLPYDDINTGRYTPFTNQTDVLARALSNDDPRKGEKIYSVGTRSTVDYFFGMEMSASFTQTASGLDAWGHDIIFEFSGDDDFWLYVDGELVIDLGGVHSAQVGTVNFRTGVITSSNGNSTLYDTFRSNYEARGLSEELISTKLDEIFTQNEDGKYVFRDYTSHTMRMFYMERGAGASNLHMRFNLAAVKPGTFTLSKKLSGTDQTESDIIEFPYQIYYRSEKDGEYREYLLGEKEEERSYVTYTGTSSPVPYQAEFTPAGGTEAYQHVFFLKPGESAEVRLPDGATEYRVVECGVNPAVYNAVSVNGTPLSGTETDNMVNGTAREDYTTGSAALADRSSVAFDNHVSEGAMRNLTLTKRLYAEDGDSRLNYPDDKTMFSFRLYLGSENTNPAELPAADMYEYHVKNMEGYYCYWNTEEQEFSSTGIQDHDALMRSEYAVAATFTTSMSGAISNIPADHTVEIRNLIAGTQFKVEERAGEIPKGYTLRLADGYSRLDEGHKASQTEPISGTVEVNNDPELEVRNQKGWGLTVEKVWTDKDFMASHDPIWFAVFFADETGKPGAMVPDTVRQLNSTDSSIYYFFQHLENGKKFEDYVVYEVTLSPEAGQNLNVDSDGVVTGYNPETVIPVESGSRITVGGTPAGGAHQDGYEYTAVYTQGEMTDRNENVRTDTWTNSRPGIMLYKTDWSGNRLSGATFTLTGEDGSNVGADRYTSGQNGLITIAYLSKGVYTLNETAAPKGYAGIKEPITIAIGENDDVTVTGPEGYYAVSETAQEGMMAEITIKNRPSAFQIKKVGIEEGEEGEETGETLLPGVHFALYRQVRTIDGDVQKDIKPIQGYGDLVTDANGIVPKISMSLEAGTYYLTETRTLKGYELLQEDLCFTIGEDGTVTIENEDEAYQDWIKVSTDESGNVSYVVTIPNKLEEITKWVRFKKTDMIGSALGSAVFTFETGEVDEESKPVILTLTSGENDGFMATEDGTNIFELAISEENKPYILTETDAPAGYIMLTGKVKIYVYENDVRANLEGSVTPPEVSGQGTEEDPYVVTIKNSNGYVLPSTGGEGTMIFSVLGTILILSSTLLILAKRKQEAYTPRH